MHFHKLALLFFFLLTKAILLLDRDSLDNLGKDFSLTWMFLSPQPYNESCSKLMHNVISYFTLLQNICNNTLVVVQVC